MTILGLLIAVLATAVLVWLCQRGSIPEPFSWIVYLVLVVVWIIILLDAAGIGILNTPIHRVAFLYLLSPLLA